MRPFAALLALCILPAASQAGHPVSKVFVNSAPLYCPTGVTYGYNATYPTVVAAAGNYGYAQNYSSGYQDYAQAQSQAYDKGEGVVGALAEIAKQKQAYDAMREGLQSLGFSDQAVTQQNYVQQQYEYQVVPQQQVIPYAQAPYQQGTTAYQVESIQTDAFGPQDARELAAMMSSYIAGAQGSAGQIATRLSTVTEQVTQSVQAQANTALRVAEIEAENRGKQITSEAMLQTMQLAIKAMGADQQQSRQPITVQAAPQPQVCSSCDGSGCSTCQSQTHIPSNHPPEVVVQAAPVAALQAHCMKCHDPRLEEPKGGVTLDLQMGLTAEQYVKSVAAVASGTMPPEKDLEPAVKHQLLMELHGLLPPAE